MREAVVEAVLELLADEGYGAFNHERVAQRAGVTKKTVYRWWPTKAHLLLDAIHVGTPEGEAVADTGSLRGDLVALGQVFEERFGEAERLKVEAIDAALDRASADHPEIAESRAQLWRSRIRVVHELLERAAARGDGIPGADPYIVGAALFGTGYLLGSVFGWVAGPGYVPFVVDLVLYGAARVSWPSQPVAAPAPGSSP